MTSFIGLTSSDAPQDLPSQIIAATSVWKDAAPGNEVRVAGLSAGRGFAERLSHSRGVPLSPLACRDGAGRSLLTPVVVDGSRWVSEADGLLGVGQPGPATGEYPAPVSDACTTSAAGTTDSAAVGDLIAVALQQGASELILSVGPTPVHDAGRGMIQRLSGSPVVDQAALATVRQRLGNLRLVVASSYEAPLRGLGGAGAELPHRTDLTASQAQSLEAQAREVMVAMDDLWSSRDLAAGGYAAANPSRVPWGGAGGGIAAMLFALGGQLRPAAQVFAELVDLDAALESVDLVVLVVDLLDGQALADGGSVGQVVTRLGGSIAPVVVVTGEALAGPRQYAQSGIHAVYEVDSGDARRPGTTPWLSQLARVARNWVVPR